MIQFLKKIWYAQRNANMVNKYFERVQQYEIADVCIRLCLLDIVAQEKPTSNATVKRMARIARGALK